MTFTDADSTSWTATVDYGDGAGAQSVTISGESFGLNHTYNVLGQKTVTVKVCDNQGLCTTATFKVTAVDTTPPVVTGTIVGTPNSAGWFKTNVTITWSSFDPAPSSGGPTQPAATLVSSEGANQIITSAQSCDAANNCATGTKQVSIDKTAPTGTLDAPLLGVLITRVLGQTVTGTAADTYSGVTGVSVKYTSALNNFGTGTSNAARNCNASKTSCTWSAALPGVPGLYTMVVTITDVAGNTHSLPPSNLTVIV